MEDPQSLSESIKEDFPLMEDIIDDDGRLQMGDLQSLSESIKEDFPLMEDVIDDDAVTDTCNILHLEVQ